VDLKISYKQPKGTALFSPKSDWCCNFCGESSSLITKLSNSNLVHSGSSTDVETVTLQSFFVVEDHKDVNFVCRNPLCGRENHVNIEGENEVVYEKRVTFGGEVIDPRPSKPKPTLSHGSRYNSGLSSISRTHTVTSSSLSSLNSGSYDTDNGRFSVSSRQDMLDRIYNQVYYDEFGPHSDDSFEDEDEFFLAPSRKRIKTATSDRPNESKTSNILASSSSTSLAVPNATVKSNLNSDCDAPEPLKSLLLTFPNPAGLLLQRWKNVYSMGHPLDRSKVLQKNCQNFLDLCVRQNTQLQCIDDIKIVNHLVPVKFSGAEKLHYWRQVRSLDFDHNSVGSGSSSTENKSLSSGQPNNSNNESKIRLTAEDLQKRDKLIHLCCHFNTRSAVEQHNNHLNNPMAGLLGGSHYNSMMSPTKKSLAEINKMSSDLKFSNAHKLDGADGAENEANLILHQKLEKFIEACEEVKNSLREMDLWRRAAGIGTRKGEWPQTPEQVAELYNLRRVGITDSEGPENTSISSSALVRGSAVFSEALVLARESNEEESESEKNDLDDELDKDADESMKKCLNNGLCLFDSASLKSLHKRKKNAKDMLATVEPEIHALLEYLDKKFLPRLVRTPNAEILWACIFEPRLHAFNEELQNHHKNPALHDMPDKVRILHLGDRGSDKVLAGFYGLQKHNFDPSVFDSITVRSYRSDINFDNITLNINNRNDHSNSFATQELHCPSIFDYNSTNRWQFMHEPEQQAYYGLMQRVAQSNYPLRVISRHCLTRFTNAVRQAALKAKPWRHYQSVMKVFLEEESDENAEARSCSICLEEDIPLTRLCLTPCSHLFCVDCLYFSVQTVKPECPECRGKLDPSKDLRPLMDEVVGFGGRGQSNSSNHIKKHKSNLKNINRSNVEKTLTSEAEGKKLLDNTDGDINDEDVDDGSEAGFSDEEDIFKVRRVKKKKATSKNTKSSSDYSSSSTTATSSSSSLNVNSPCKAVVAVSKPNKVQRDLDKKLSAKEFLNRAIATGSTTGKSLGTVKPTMEDLRDLLAGKGPKNYHVYGQDLQQVKDNRTFEESDEFDIRMGDCSNDIELAKAESLELLSKKDVENGTVQNVDEKAIGDSKLYNAYGSKIQALCRVLDKIRNEEFEDNADSDQEESERPACLVFCQNEHLKSKIAAAFTEIGYPFLEVKGGASTQSRAILNFQNGTPIEECDIKPKLGPGASTSSSSKWSINGANASKKSPNKSKANSSTSSTNLNQDNDVLSRFHKRIGLGSSSNDLNKTTTTESPNRKLNFVLLLSMETGAAGANLTRANHLLFVHPSNFETKQKIVAHEKQAIGRIRRMGQKRKHIHVWRFFMVESLEELMIREWRNGKKERMLMSNR